MPILDLKMIAEMRPSADARLISCDPEAGTTTWWMKYDEDHCGVVTRTYIDPVIDDNQKMLNDSLNKRWGDGKVAARIPLDLYFSTGYAEAKRNHDKKWIKRFLNDPDYRKLRTFHGRV